MSETQFASEPLRALELYCGIGGFAAALETIDGVATEVVTAVDIHRGALEVYGCNFRHPTRVAHIDSLPPATLRSLDASLWWMSPPCQPFTRRGLQRDTEDPRAQGFLRLVETLGRVRPRYVAMENVPGFQGSRTHARLREVLDDAGYRVREHLLCPTELGLPNRRRRFYLTAARGPTSSSPRPFPLPSPELRPLGELLDTDPEPGLEADPELLHRYRHAIDVVDADDPAALTATFTSAYGRSPVRSGSFLRQRDGSIRHFSPREILRLLGFPETYRLPSDLPRNRVWRLVGNSLSLPPVRAALRAGLPEALERAAPSLPR